MDLRIVKTKEAVKKAFLEYRKTLPIEKIKVIDICSSARINKTTFYKHYQDIYALNEELEKEILAEFQRNFKVCDQLFSNPEVFIRGIPLAMESQKESLNTLFRGRFNVFFRLVENDMKEYYSTVHPEGMTPARVSFIVSGTIRMLEDMNNKAQFDENTIAEIVSAIKDLCR